MSSECLSFNPEPTATAGSPSRDSRLNLPGTCYGRFQSVAHDLLCLAHDGIKVGLVLEAFRIDLVNVLRSGGPGREPAADSHDLQTADRGIVARGAGELGRDRLAGQLPRLDSLRRQA